MQRNPMIQGAPPNEPRRRPFCKVTSCPRGALLLLALQATAACWAPGPAVPFSSRLCLWHCTAHKRPTPGARRPRHLASGDRTLVWIMAHQNTRPELNGRAFFVCACVYGRAAFEISYICVFSGWGGGAFKIDILCASFCICVCCLGHGPPRARRRGRKCNWVAAGPSHRRSALEPDSAAGPRASQQAGASEPARGVTACSSA